MSRTNRKSPQTRKYAYWVYTHPKKQNITILSDYDDDDIKTKYYKEKTYEDKPFYWKNYNKFMNIVKSFVNKKFVDFEQCVKSSGFYEQCKNYVNFKSQKIESINYYVNSHGYICCKKIKRNLAPISVIKTGSGAVLVSSFSIRNQYYCSDKVPSDKYMEQNVIYYQLNTNHMYGVEVVDEDADRYCRYGIVSIKAYCLIGLDIYTFPDINNLANRYIKNKEQRLKYSHIDDLLLNFQSMNFNQFKQYCQHNFKKLAKVRTNNHPFTYWR